MVTVKDVSEIFNKDVYTDKGYYVGRAEDLELDLSKFKIRSLKIEVSKNTVFGRLIGGKRGLIIPYSLVKAVGDIIIIEHALSQELEKGVEEELET